MTKGLKSNFPLYARRLDGAHLEVLGNCTLRRVTRKQWERFLKERHGNDVNVEEYVLLEVYKVE